jgi:hypothetical protein
MPKIDHNLPHDDPRNLAAARKHGLTWSSEQNGFIDQAGKLVGPGYDEVNDTRWGHMSESDAVYAHK